VGVYKNLITHLHHAIVIKTEKEGTREDEEDTEEDDEEDYESNTDTD